MIHKSWVKLLIPFAIASLFPSLAIGQEATLASGDDWAVYATANGSALQGILEASRSLVDSGSYKALFSLIALLAFLGYAVSAAVDAKKITNFIGILAFMVFISQVMLDATADVVVIDNFNGTVHGVSDVPFGIAAPISVVSTAGHRLTELLEQTFSTPAQLKVSASGSINMGSSLISDAATMQIQDPNLRATLAAFSEDCILPSIAGNDINGNAIVNSQKLFGSGGTLENVNPGLVTKVYSDLGEQSTYCSGNGDSNSAEGNVHGQLISKNSAYDYISKYFEIAAPHALARSTGTMVGTPAFNWTENALSSAQTYLSGGALTAGSGESVRQSAAANMLKDGIVSATSGTGSDPLATNIAYAQAINSQESSWVQSAQLFNDISGYIFSLLQALMLGLMPIILLAAFIPGGQIKILISAVQVLVWLALWQPTFAILNFIVTEYAKGPLGTNLDGASNYTMMNAPIVSEMTNRFTAAAGFMGASVPMITWGLVKGGIGLTQFVSGAIGQNYASQAASMSATGNISLGNESYDNYAANSMQSAPNYGVGGGAVSASSSFGGTTMSGDVGANLALEGGQSIQQTQLTESQKDSFQQAKSQKESGQSQVQEGVRGTVEGARNFSDQLGKAVENKASQNDSTSQGDVIKDSETHSKMMQLAEQVAEETSGEVTASSMGKAMASLNIGANSADGLKLSGSAGYDWSAEEKEQFKEGYKDVSSGSTQDTFSQALESADSATREQMVQTLESATETAKQEYGEQFKESSQKIAASTDTYSEGYDLVDTANDTMERLQSQTLSSRGVNLNNAGSMLQELAGINTDSLYNDSPRQSLGNEAEQGVNDYEDHVKAEYDATLDQLGISHTDASRILDDKETESGNYSVAGTEYESRKNALLAMDNNARQALTDNENGFDFMQTPSLDSLEERTDERIGAIEDGAGSLAAAAQLGEPNSEEAASHTGVMGMSVSNEVESIVEQNQQRMQERENSQQAQELTGASAEDAGAMSKAMGSLAKDNVLGGQHDLSQSDRHQIGTLSAALTDTHASLVENGGYQSGDVARLASAREAYQSLSPELQKEYSDVGETINTSLDNALGATSNMGDVAQQVAQFEGQAATQLTQQSVDDNWQLTNSENLEKLAGEYAAFRQGIDPGQIEDDGLQERVSNLDTALNNYTSVDLTSASPAEKKSESEGAVISTNSERVFSGDKHPDRTEGEVQALRQEMGIGAQNAAAVISPNSSLFNKPQNGNVDHETVFDALADPKVSDAEKQQLMQQNDVDPADLTMLGFDPKEVNR